MRGNAKLARYAAPAAFLLAATVAILLVRAGLSNGSEAVPPPAPPAATTAVAEPVETQSVETQPVATTTAGGGTTTEPADAEFYEIEAGDTLAVVADRFDTTVEQLYVLNPEVDPVALTIGQRIRVK